MNRMTQEPHDVFDGMIDVFGPRIAPPLTMTGDEGDYCLICSIVPPATVVPLYDHADRKTLYVLGGTLEVYTTGAWGTFETDDVIDVPPDSMHSIRNMSSVPAEALLITTGKMTRFFREVGRSLDQAGPPTPTQMSLFMTRALEHGHRLGSADENAMAGITLG